MTADPVRDRIFRFAAATAEAKAILARGATPKWRALANVYRVHEDTLRKAVRRAPVPRRAPVKGSKRDTSIETVERVVVKAAWMGFRGGLCTDVVSLPRVRWLERPMP